MCSQCNSDNVRKAIFIGFPMKICSECSHLFGLWSFIFLLFPIPTFDEYGEPYFKFMYYTGPYGKALWVWLFGKFNENGEYIP